MIREPRVLLNGAAVAIFSAVNLTALALGPGHGRPALFLFALFAVLAAAQCASWDPALLTWALAFSVPPVVALAGGDGTAWLIGPLGALLLLASELNTLGWEYHGTPPASAVVRRRLRQIGGIAGAGIVAALAIGFAASAPSSSGGIAVAVTGAAAVALTGRVLFGRARTPRPHER